MGVELFIRVRMRTRVQVQGLWFEKALVRRAWGLGLRACSPKSYCKNAGILAALLALLLRHAFSQSGLPGHNGTQAVESSYLYMSF